MTIPGGPAFTWTSLQAQRRRASAADLQPARAGGLGYKQERTRDQAGGCPSSRHPPWLLKRCARGRTGLGSSPAVGVADVASGLQEPVGGAVGDGGTSWRCGGGGMGGFGSPGGGREGGFGDGGWGGAPPGGVPAGARARGGAG